MDSVWKIIFAVTSLDLNDTDTTYMVPRPGLNSQPVHLEHVACSGTELSLLDCSYTSDTGQNDHSKDVGVRCVQGQL